MVDDRKVRGSQIRSSRGEKSRRDSDRRSRRDARRLGDGDGEQSAAPRTPDLGPFVETPSVEAVLDRVDRWLRVGRPVNLVGPTGCGKTAMAVAAARRRDRPVVFLNGDADIETSDLVGEYGGEERYSVRDKYVHNVQKSKDIVRDRWVDNPLTVAAQTGATLVYNEFARTKPVANNVLLSVFEEGLLELPGRRGDDRYVEVHPEFRAVLTSNSVEYAGVHDPQDALLDRLIGFHVDYQDAETERRIVSAHTDLSDEQVAEVVEVIRSLRSRLEFTVGTRAAVMAAEGLGVAEDASPATMVEVVVDVLASKAPDREAVDRLEDAVADVVDQVVRDE